MKQYYILRFLIFSSDKSDACTIVSKGTPRERRLAAIFSLASFSPLALSLSFRKLRLLSRPYGINYVAVGIDAILVHF